MADRYLDLSPLEAVELAQAETDWEYLDRYLRSRFIAYLQNRSGDRRELRSAVLKAVLWAKAQEQAPWVTVWPFMLGLLRDADRLPSTAQDLGVLKQPEGRAAEVLAVLAAHGGPMRPRDVALELGLSPQHIGNVSRRLEEGGLIARHRAEGRATWMFATARGLRLAAAFPAARRSGAASASSGDRDLAPETRPWDEGAMHEGPEIKVA
jgi:DNA-binding MarR family transcriptional regulator